MRIQKLIVGDFGKLSDVSISLDERVTVITGKNEAGKSSIASFIKYVLYGFSGSRSSNLSENGKKKYMPWDKDSCSGELHFTSDDGKSYRAVRFTSTKNQSGVFDSDDMPTDITCAGEHFLGVDEGCFKKTAFIGESNVSFSDSGELDEAIRNIVYSADEGVDSSKALKKLENMRKFYLGKTGKTGAITELTREIDELCQERDKWQNGHKELMAAEYNLNEISNRIVFNESQKKNLEKEQENSEAFKAKNLLDEIDKLKAQASKSKTEFEEHFSIMKNGSFVPDINTANELEDLLRSIESNMQMARESASDVENARMGVESVYADHKQRLLCEKLDKAQTSAVEVLDQLRELEAKSKKLLITAIILCFFIITIPVSIVLFAKRSRLKKEIHTLCETLECDNSKELERILSGISNFRTVEKSAKDILKNAAEKNMNLEARLRESKQALQEQALKCGFENHEVSSLTDAAKEYLVRLHEWLEKQSLLKSKCDHDNVAYSTLIGSVDIDNITATAAKYDESIQVRDESIIRRELAFYTQANEALTVKERELEKTAAVLAGTLPKPAEIQSRINSLIAQREDYTKKHAALDMAISCLEKACESMKKQASPLITADSGELFSKITHGKYSGLFADSSMNLSFADQKSNLPREAGFLSTGTLDAAYISLRIALCKYLYKQQPVLVFDDAFSHMDDERLNKVLEHLWDLSEEFQIVILSCHSREKAFFKGKGKIIDFEIAGE